MYKRCRFVKRPPAKADVGSFHFAEAAHRDLA
jgi:hypothetical protein